ncbi:uncharacterized protein DUF3826 [Mucilaginibacter yixingensis]|uniref:Uncharacterized protein DUF3826 n=1 Tax=Mucilaginibacter yixingensis TaxID=1295612 RepID=A0A2T5J8G7_9SPHI|nr:DUF3826 domain-containing protein [Mucilaginibacter yixingensis]PTQ95751.1 uncharacterized protein DUF3826 [Mucilaginibacter yixingensis]
MNIKKYIVTLLLPIVSVGAVSAQAKQSEADYNKVITERAGKIVTTIGVTDSVKFKKVREVIADQYKALGTIHDGRNAEAKAIKDAAGVDKNAANAKIAALDSSVNQKLSVLHKEYLTKLGKQLTPDQITAVKNGMTFNVLNVTYNAYMDELPNLTEAQKTQIMAWLVEARELAIDAESANKKHEVFGKYKGRINNYLSKQGYDMKKAGEEWQQRIKARQEAAGKDKG